MIDSVMKGCEEKVSTDFQVLIHQFLRVLKIFSEIFLTLASETYLAADIKEERIIQIEEETLPLSLKSHWRKLLLV